MPLRDPLWTLESPASDGNAEAPVAGDGAVFFGSRYGGSVPLEAVDERNGKARWKSDMLAAPLDFSDRIVIGVTNDARRFDVARVVALDSRTGALRWSTPGEYVAVERGLAIVVTRSHLEARDANSGSLRWRGVWNGYNPQEVRLLGTTLLLRTVESGATMVGVLYAYDVRNGRALWVHTANAILGVLPGGNLALDTTWEPGAFAGYAPLTVAVVALSSGAVLSTESYAPDRERWSGSDDHDVHFAQDAATDGNSLVFRIGSNTVYRYHVGADPQATAGTRYEFGPLNRVAADTWLVRLHDGNAAVARLATQPATVAHVSGLDSVIFSGAYDGLALVVATGRAVVFDPLHPGDAAATRFPCAAVARAFVSEGALVAECTAPGARFVALNVPQDHPFAAPATPLSIAAPPERGFRATMHAYAVPTKFMRTGSAAFAGDGTLWFCERALFSTGVNGHSDFIAHLKAGGTIDEFPVPTFDAGIGSIARGPDGAMWFTEASALKIGRIGADGTVVEYPLPPELDRDPVFPRIGPPPLADPAKIGVGPRAAVREFQKLGGLVAGPDDALWFTAPYANAVVRITTAGAVHVFALPAGLTVPGHIARGPDGALWFSAYDAIGRITTQGVAAAFPIPQRAAVTSVVWGPGGNVWFSIFDGRVGRVTPKGEMKIFPAPVVAAPSGPLIGGCDGALYVADNFRPALWRLTTAGRFEEHDVDYSIGHIARAPDCTLGFTESQGPATAHVGTISF